MALTDYFAQGTVARTWCIGGRSASQHSAAPSLTDRTTNALQGQWQATDPCVASLANYVGMLAASA